MMGEQTMDLHKGEKRASFDTFNKRLGAGGAKGAGRASPSDFVRSVNPIPTWGADYAHHILLTPRIFRPSVGSEKHSRR